MGGDVSPILPQFINLRNVVTTWVLFDYALAEIEKVPTFLYLK